MHSCGHGVHTRIHSAICCLRQVGVCDLWPSALKAPHTTSDPLHVLLDTQQTCSLSHGQAVVSSAWLIAVWLLYQEWSRWELVSLDA